ncbi:MAG: NYN domain-containing protein [Elusimicrobiota bacterium]
MAVHYIIDGYNLIKSKQDFFPVSLRQAREKLISLIKKRRPQGSLRNMITVVFDGRPGVDSPAEKKVMVIFTRGREADSYIEQITLKSKNPASVIAVTDDRVLRKKVREAGGRFMPVDYFMKKLFPPSRREGYGKDKKSIDEDEKKSINRELKKIWDKI